MDKILNSCKIDVEVILYVYFFITEKAREALNITRTTILRWEEQGKIKAYKTSGGH